MRIIDAQLNIQARGERYLEQFQSKLFVLLFIILLLLGSHQAQSQQESSPSVKILHIDYQINPIFNSQEATGWIYKTANKLHINSKRRVVERLLPFKQGDSINPSDIEEAVRILRGQRFFRDAKISLSTTDNPQEVTLLVETWENWTLLPTVDISREGGVTEYAYGIEDDNFLGQGLLARMEYFSEQERDGYSLRLQSDVLTDFHLKSSILASKTNDGEQYQLLLEKPFYTLGDSWAARALFEDSQLLQTIYSDDEKVNRFGVERQTAELSIGYSAGLRSINILRYKAGLDLEKVSFALDPLTAVLPQDRQASVAWLGLEFLQDRYVKKRNLYLIGRIEDIRLGWHHQAKLGLNLDSGEGKDALHWSWRSRWTEQLNRNNFINSGFNIEAQEKGAVSVATRYYNLYYEHFYKASETRTWYAKLNYLAATNPFIDRPVVIGGETGLRGFPQAFQHGDKRYLLNLEKRYYPGLNLFKLLDVGFVGFIDVGRASGQTPYLNPEDKTLVSAGLGLRLFLTRSSGRTLININMAKPLNSERVKDVDFSVTLTSTL